MYRKNRKHLAWLKKKISEGEDVSTLKPKLTKAPRVTLTKKNKQVSQETKDALMCVNPKCVAVNFRKSIKPRDALCLLAISLSGLT